MCLAEFKGFAQLCLCRRVRIRNFVFPALVTAFSPRALLGFGVFKLRRVLVRKVPNIKPELNEHYKHLCSSSVPFTEFLFGDDSDLSKQLKDLAEGTKVSKKLSRGDPQNGRPQTPGAQVFQARQVQKIWILIQRSSDGHKEAVKLEIAKLLDNVVVVESAPSEGDFISPIFLRLK